MCPLLNEVVRERPLEFGDDQLTEGGAKSAKNSPQRRKGREVQTQSTEGCESARGREDAKLRSQWGCQVIGATEGRQFTTKDTKSTEGFESTRGREVEAMF